MDGDDVLVRSWLGLRGHWYVHAVKRPDQLKLHVRDRVIPIRAVHVTDDDSIDKCSRGFLAKYPDSPSTPAMVNPKIFEYTLRLDPR